MNPYIASIPLVLLVVLMISFNVYFNLQRKRKQREEYKERFFKVRSRLIKYINRQLRDDGRVYNRALHYKLKYLEVEHPDIYFDMDINDGLFVITMEGGLLATEITGYMEIPSFNKENNITYEVF